MRVDIILGIILLVSFTIYSFASLGGFVNFDESSFVLQTMKFFRNIKSPTENFIGILWPDGTDGPVFIYIESISLFLFSYILNFPVDLSARIPSVFMNTLNVYLIYLLSLKLFGRRNIALIAASLYAVIPISIHYAHIAVAESTVIFFMLASIVSILHSVEKKDERLILLSGLCFGLGLATKLTIALSIIPIAYLVYAKFRPNIQKIFLLFLIPVVILQIPFIAVNLYTDNSVLNVILQRHSGKPCYFNGLENVCDNLYLIKILERGLTLPLLILFIISIFYLLLSRSTEKNFVIIWFSIPFLYLLNMGDIFPQYALPLIPPIIVSLGYFFGSIIDRNVRNKLPVIATIVLISIVFLYSVQNHVLTKRNFPIGNIMIDDVNFKPDGISIYKSAAQFVLSNSLDDDITVLNNPSAIYVFLKRPIVLNWVIGPNFISNDSITIIAYHRGYYNVTLNESFKYIILEGKDYYEIKSKYPSALDHLNCVYNITQQNKLLICVALNKRYAGYIGNFTGESVDNSLKDYIKLYYKYKERIVY